jgi:hypothetical protein
MARCSCIRLINCRAGSGRWWLCTTPPPADAPPRKVVAGCRALPVLFEPPSRRARRRPSLDRAPCQRARAQSRHLKVFWHRVPPQIPAPRRLAHFGRGLRPHGETWLSGTVFQMVTWFGDAPTGGWAIDARLLHGQSGLSRDEVASLEDAIRARCVEVGMPFFWNPEFVEAATRGTCVPVM